MSAVMAPVALIVRASHFFHLLCSTRTSLVSTGPANARDTSAPLCAEPGAGLFGDRPQFASTGTTISLLQVHKIVLPVLCLTQCISHCPAVTGLRCSCSLVPSKPRPKGLQLPASSTPVFVPCPSLLQYSAMPWPWLLLDCS